MDMADRQPKSSPAIIEPVCDSISKWGSNPNAKENVYRSDEIQAIESKSGETLKIV